MKRASLDSRFGRYRVIRQLGRGGMGRVLLAELNGDFEFARRVVLKIPGDQRGPACEALIREARLGATLVHRNIVPVLGLEKHGDEAVIVLEHVEGVDLRRLLNHVGRLPWRLAVFIGAELAAGLDYVHRKVDGGGRSLHLVHRDISPENVLCSTEGEVKLTDFGVARVARSDSASVSGVKGKLAYMAPEHARGEPISSRADLYSLGVLLYECVSGDSVEPAGGTGRKFSVDRALVPRELEEVILTATAERASERFASAQHMRAALLQIEQRMESSAAEGSQGAIDVAAQLAAAVRATQTNAGPQFDALLSAESGSTSAASAPTAAAARRRRMRYGTGTAALVAIAILLTVWVRFTAQPRAPTAAAQLTPTAPPRSLPEPEDPSAATGVPQPARGTLSVNSLPWASVFIDGRPAGHTPLERIRLSAGDHHIVLVSRTGKKIARQVTIRSGAEARVGIDFSQ
jgi:serine/threonine-protein kinase